jgi:O-antigen/teichoic acid export membrane protein
MTNKDSIFKLAFSILQRDVFIFVLSILTGALVARKLGPDLLGVWVLLSLVPSYAEAFGRLKTDVASIYILGSKQEKPQEILFFNNLVALIASLSISLALLWQLDFIDQMLFNQSTSHKHELFLLICFIPFEFLLLNYSYYFIAQENVSTYNKLNLYRALLNAILIYLFLFFYDFNILGVVLSKVIPSFIILMFAWISVDRRDWKAFSFKFNKSLAKKVLGYSKNFYFTGVITHIFELTTKTLGAFFLKNSDIAFYSQGESSSKLLNKIPEALAVILYPRISSLGKEDSKEISIKSFKVTLIILTLLGFLLSLVAKKLIVFLYGSAFETSADVLLIAIPGVVIGASCLTLKPFFEGMGRANLIPVIQIPPLILQLIFGYFLINSFGLIGAALTFSLGFLTLGISFLITFIYLNSVPVSDMLPRLVDLKFIYLTIIDIVRKKLNRS